MINDISGYLPTIEFKFKDWIDRKKLKVIQKDMMTEKMNMCMIFTGRQKKTCEEMPYSEYDEMIFKSKKKNVVIIVNNFSLKWIIDSILIGES